MQTFKVGDKAVYPGQGVGEVMGIEHRGHRRVSPVFLRAQDVMEKRDEDSSIPINKVGSVGLRIPDRREGPSSKCTAS